MACSCSPPVPGWLLVCHGLLRILQLLTFPGASGQRCLGLQFTRRRSRPGPRDEGDRSGRDRPRAGNRSAGPDPMWPQSSSASRMTRRQAPAHGGSGSDWVDDRRASPVRPPVPSEVLTIDQSVLWRRRRHPCAGRGAARRPSRRRSRRRVAASLTMPAAWRRPNGWRRSRWIWICAAKSSVPVLVDAAEEGVTGTATKLDLAEFFGRPVDELCHRVRIGRRTAHGAWASPPSAGSGGQFPRICPAAGRRGPLGPRVQQVRQRWPPRCLTMRRRRGPAGGMRVEIWHQTFFTVTAGARNP